MLWFLEFEGLAFVCFGTATAVGEGGPSCKGKLDLLFLASLASLVLLNLTLPRFVCGLPPELPGLLGFALESALGSSEEISLYLAW
jgi:hypothetical protein